MDPLAILDMIKGKVRIPVPVLKHRHSVCSQLANMAEVNDSLF